MAIISSKRNGAGLVGQSSGACQPGFCDYIIETRLMMNEHRVEDCLKGLSDATLDTLGFNARERAKIKGRVDTV
ncbi:MAG TPA: hypothetical protein ENK28_00185 [Aliiroseovarius sp.]|nr:hypothetical protein [Aliiroseovarius sp.]